MDVPRLAGALDVDQQVHQAGGALCSLPCRFPPPTRVHLVRLVPWRHQGLRFVQPQCGKLRSPPHLRFYMYVDAFALLTCFLTFFAPEAIITCLQ